jgi:rhodanese-related sulfurtransferase
MWWKALIVLVVLELAWEAAWPLFGVPQVPPWSLAATIAEDQAPVIVDVRTPAEYGWFHAPGALNLPFPLNPAELDVSEDAEIVVACMTGHRSPIAAKRLEEAGYENVSNLLWGMLGYRLFGGPVETGRQSF